MTKKAGTKVAKRSATVIFRLRSTDGYDLEPELIRDLKENDAIDKVDVTVNSTDKKVYSALITCIMHTTHATEENLMQAIEYLKMTIAKELEWRRSLPDKMLEDTDDDPYYSVDLSLYKVFF